MALHHKPEPRKAREVEATLHGLWIRRNPGSGAEYHLAQMGFVVKKVTWREAGLSGRNRTGWGVFLNGERRGPAYPRAVDAQAAAEGQIISE